MKQLLYLCINKTYTIMAQCTIIENEVQCCNEGRLRKNVNIVTCDKHRDRFKQYGDYHYITKPNSTREYKIGATCCKVIENGVTCNGLGKINKSTGKMYFSNGYCTKHDRRFKEHGDPLIIKIKQGEHRKEHPLYATYKNVRARCYGEYSTSYRWYGAIGIKMCDRWLGVDGFNHFCEDMGERPEGMTLERNDYTKDYTPENCRWATRHEQAANTRSNVGNLGVYKTYNNKWRARITVNAVTNQLYFNTEEEAIKGRKLLEKLYLKTD